MADIQALEEKVNRLVDFFGGDATEISREIQTEVLEELYKLRTVLVAELAEGPKPAAAPENAALREQVAALEEENARLRYRVEHLRQHVA